MSNSKGFTDKETTIYKYLQVGSVTPLHLFGSSDASF